MPRHNTLLHTALMLAALGVTFPAEDRTYHVYTPTAPSDEARQARMNAAEQKRQRKAARNLRVTKQA